MNVSGAEAVVAAASPWIGQGSSYLDIILLLLKIPSGESACLVKPYVDRMWLTSNEKISH